jgi:hypothetical protein
LVAFVFPGLLVWNSVDKNQKSQYFFISIKKGGGNMDDSDLTVEQLFERAEKAETWQKAIETLTRLWVRMDGDKLNPDDPPVQRWRNIHAKQVAVRMMNANKGEK